MVSPCSAALLFISYLPLELHAMVPVLVSSAVSPGFRPAPDRPPRLHVPLSQALCSLVSASLLLVF
ncbi:hypothetical protein HK096_007947, partial [Nowakowskiella sp. JEL0078]